jgi:alkylhydroperoxidase family enzyme
MALAAGVPQAAIDAIEHWQPASFFTPPERAALAYVEQVAKDGIVDDAVFAGLQRHFNPREVTEITALCSYYVGNSRFVKALRIEPESD